MGLYEHFWDDTREEWEKQGLPQNADFVDFFSYDIRPVPNSFFTMGPFPLTLRTIDETDETVVLLNDWGATIRKWKHKAGTPEIIAFGMDSEKTWREKYRDNFLTLNLKRFGDLDQLKRDYQACMATDQFVVYRHHLVFEVMRGCFGDIAMLEAMYMNTSWILDFCDVYTSSLIMHMEYLFREVGVPDGVFIYEDMGYTYGPFCSPELQRELIFPYHRRFADFIHSYGIPMIMHSCGKIRPFLQAIFDAGIDCLQVLEAKADQDVREFAEATGNKLAFMGNMNIVAFETNDYKAIESEIIPKLRDIRLKRIPYVFHSDHSIPKTVKLETYQYILDVFRKNGYY